MHGDVYVKLDPEQVLVCLSLSLSLSSSTQSEGRHVSTLPRARARPGPRSLCVKAVCDEDIRALSSEPPERTLKNPTPDGLIREVHAGTGIYTRSLSQVCCCQEFRPPVLSKYTAMPPYPKQQEKPSSGAALVSAVASERNFAVLPTKKQRKAAGVRQKRAAVPVLLTRVACSGWSA